MCVDRENVKDKIKAGDSRKGVQQEGGQNVLTQCSRMYTIAHADSKQKKKIKQNWWVAEGR